MSDELTVFISYRRADASADAGRLYDALRRRFGRENLFMDVDSLRPGEDWVDAVESAVTGCDVLLAIIGPEWVGVTGRDGELRLANELDRVRLEIEAALKRSKPVIPVLVEGATMPLSDELPESLRPLLRRHAIRVSHQTFDSDLGSLVRALRVIEKARHPRSEPRHVPVAEPPTTAAPSRPAPLKPVARPPTVPVPAPPPAASAAPKPTPTPSSAQSAGPAPVQPTPVAPTPVALTPVAPVPPVYAQPVQTYPYPQVQYVPPAVLPAPRSGTSPTTIGLIVAGIVALLVLLVVALGLIGLAAGTANATPTPVPTATPTQPPTPTPTSVPTPTQDLYAALRAAVPAAIAASCVEDSSLKYPALTCDQPSGIGVEYELFPNATELYAQYDTWLGGDGITREMANCFASPQLLPCEGPYALGTGNAAVGRVAAFASATYGDVYWTYEPTLILGHADKTLDAGSTFDDLFSYWSQTAAKINPTPSPLPWSPPS